MVLSQARVPGEKESLCICLLGRKRVLLGREHVLRDFSHLVHSSTWRIPIYHLKQPPSVNIIGVLDGRRPEQRIMKPFSRRMVMETALGGLRKFSRLAKRGCDLLGFNWLMLLRGLLDFLRVYGVLWSMAGVSLCFLGFTWLIHFWWFKRIVLTFFSPDELTPMPSFHEG